MTDLPRWRVLMLIITAAVVCYVIGFNMGFSFFLLLGGMFELVFWVTLFKNKKKSTSHQND